MFGRRKRDEALDVSSEADDLGADQEDAGLDDELDQMLDDRVDDTLVLSDGLGPYDVERAPDDGLPRLDLGGLRVPAPVDSELRLEVNETGQVIAATYVQGRNVLQVSAFAAPRREGIWREVRDEMLEGITDAGGSAELADGPLGPELRARVPEAPGQKALQPARFVGVDGPRWFLRGMFTGPAATDAAAAAALEAIFRGVVVVRGAEAMAPRDQLPLALPREAQVAVAESTETRRLPAPQRGPEITEIN
jgi:hypothetical protein